MTDQVIWTSSPTETAKTAELNICNPVTASKS